MWATLSGEVGGEGKVWCFSLVVLFLFCDDVEGDSQGICVTEQGGDGGVEEGRAGGKFNSVPDS